MLVPSNHAWANSKGKPLMHNKCGALAQVVDIFQLPLIFISCWLQEEADIYTFTGWPILWSHIMCMCVTVVVLCVHVISVLPRKSQKKDKL